MNRALIGKEYRDAEKFEVPRDRARAYADATNARIRAYEGEQAMAPPMFAVAYSFGVIAAPMFDPDLGADMMRLVHGEQDMSFYLPVKPGDIIESRSKIDDIVEKTTGELLNLSVVSTNQKGERVFACKTGLFIRGARKKENLEAEKAEKAREEAAWNAAPALFLEQEKVALDQAQRYAQASGDLNPIHVDEAVAKAAGLPGTILHGLCTMAFVHNVLVRRYGGEPLRVRRLAVRFNRPVLMGDVLSIEARGPERGPLALRVTNQSGVLVLKNGVAELV